MRSILKSWFRGDRPAETESAQQAVDRRQEERIDARRGLRILIVDDSPTVTTILSRMLQQTGYQTLEAMDGASALEIAEREQPDLIFLDIVLPGMSGFAVLRALRRKQPTQTTPVIMISGNLKATEEFYGQRIGADDFMKKPFGRSEVFVRIQRLVRLGRLPAREAAAEELDRALAETASQPVEVVDDNVNVSLQAPATAGDKAH